MADNIQIPAIGTGDTTPIVRAKDRTTFKTQIVALDLSPGAGSETLMNGVMPVSDNGGTITIDAPVGTPVFARLSNGSAPLIGQQLMAASLPVTMAVDQAAINVLTELTTADMDLGAGTDIRSVIGIALAATGGAALLPGDASGGLKAQITSVLPGTGASQLGSARDAVAGASDVGVQALAVRSDAGGSLVTGAGDYTPLQVDAAGALRVTGGGGGTEYTEDIVAASDPQGHVIIARRRDALTAAEVSADGDNIAINATSKGQLHTFSEIGTALPAGTNAIGKLAANSGVDIGSVAVLSVLPGTGANSLGKAEDAVHASGDVGVQVLAVRSDAGGTLVSATGDYSPLQVDASGALRVAGGGGGTEYTEDVASAADPTGNILLARRRDTLTAAEVSADGDNIALNATSKGQLNTYSEQMEVAGVGIGAATDAEQTGNGSVIAVLKRIRTLTGIGAATLLKAEDAAHVSGDSGVMSLAVRSDAGGALAGTTGDYSPLQVDANGALRVTGGGGGTEYTEDAASAADPVGNQLLLRRRDTLTAAEVSAEGDVIAANATAKGQLHTYSEVGSSPAAARTTDSVAAALQTDALMNGLVALTPKFKLISLSAAGASAIVASVPSKKIRILGYVLSANAAVNIKFQSHTTPTDLTGLLYLAANGGFVAPFNPAGWFEGIVGESIDINLSGAVAVGGHLIYVEV